MPHAWRVRGIPREGMFGGAKLGFEQLRNGLAGGASLEFLEGKVLPGVKALEDRGEAYGNKR